MKLNLLVISTWDEPNNNKNYFSQNLIDNFGCTLIGNSWEGRSQYLLVAVKGKKAPIYERYGARYQQSISATAYTVNPSDRFLTFSTTATCTVTLPNPGSNANRELFIKNTTAFAVNSASSNVQPLTSVTAGTAILSGAGKYAVLVSSGQVWQIVRSN